MPDIGVAPPVVPYGADQTVYLVVDCIGAPSLCHETDIERPDLEAVIADLLAGRFSSPVRVVAFNTLEHWSRDISKAIVDEICVRCDIEGIAVPEYLGDFIERHTTQTAPLAL